MNREKAARILEEVAHMAKLKGLKHVSRMLIRNAKSIRQRADIKKGWRLV